MLSFFVTVAVKFISSLKARKVSPIPKIAFFNTSLCGTCHNARLIENYFSHSRQI